MIDKIKYLIAPYGVVKLNSLFEVSYSDIAIFENYFIADKKIYFQGSFETKILDLSTFKSTTVDNENYHEEISDAEGLSYNPTTKELFVLTDDYEVMTFSISNLKAAINQFKIKE
ncbi:MAG: hypothetical protein ACK476_04505 [Fluviicola sp.]